MVISMARQTCKDVARMPRPSSSFSRRWLARAQLPVPAASRLGNSALTSSTRPELAPSQQPAQCLSGSPVDT